jgi:hypothetical protein
LDSNDFPWFDPGSTLIVAVRNGFDGQKGEEEQNDYQDKSFIGGSDRQ